MNIDIVTQDDLRRLKQELEQLIADALNAKANSPEFYTSDEVCKLLHLSKKQWQTMRDRKLISYSQIGRKIYVKRADIDAYIDEYRIEKRS